MRQGARDRALAGKDERPLNKAWVSYCFEQQRDADTTIISELGLDVSQFEFERPDQYYGVSTAGVLGWGVGAALGAKLAMPEKTVIATVGDGSYMFGVPEAGHWVSRKMNLPVLYVVWNNQRWNAVQSATRGVYPEGWQERTQQRPFSDLSPSLDFEMVCQAGRRLRRARRGPGGSARRDRARPARREGGEAPGAAQYRRGVGQPAGSYVAPQHAGALLRSQPSTQGGLTMPFQFNALIPEIYVSDFPRSLQFYVDILGFKLEYTREAPLFAFLSYQGSQLMLQQREPTDRHTGALEYPYGRGINFQIESRDVDQVVHALAAYGYPLREGVAEHWREIAGGSLAGTLEVQVLDPDGYYLRFAQNLGENKSSRDWA